MTSVTAEATEQTENNYLFVLLVDPDVDLMYRWVNDGMSSDKVVQPFETLRPLHLIPNTRLNQERNLARGYVAQIRR